MQPRRLLRVFYLNLTIQERLGKRDLERQINAGVFERTRLADSKLSPVVRVLPQDITNVFKDTYVFEFLHLPTPYSESKGLVKHLKQFRDVENNNLPTILPRISRISTNY